MLRFITWCIVMSSCLLSVQAQDIAENSSRAKASIRGYVKDQLTEKPIAGVVVELLNVSPRQSAVSDSLGFFDLGLVPPGRHRLLLYADRYEEVMVPDIISSAGQELSLDLFLARRIEKKERDENMPKLPPLERVKSRGDNPYNPLSGIASRPFTPEEVLRYAGARFDPALLVTNFAGVSNYDDAQNDIVVRGNNPTGLLWQIEELPIENPNHLNSYGRSGGSLPILSMFTLGKADFNKGVLSAQYGNTNAGVFDISLRDGNRQRLSTMLMLGLQRGEALIEGPIKGGGSFLVGARVSGLGQFLQDVLPTDPLHQDMSFKINLGQRSWGRLEFFGVGGLSGLNIPHTEGGIIDKIRYQIFEFEDFEHRNQMGLLGAKYSLNISENILMRHIVGLNYQGSTSDWTLNDFGSGAAEPELLNSYTINNRRLNYLAHSYLQGQNSKALTWRAGLLFAGHQLNLIEFWDIEEAPDTDFQGFRYSARAYGQVRWDINRHFYLFSGLSTMYNSFNEELSFDPRLVFAYTPSDRHRIALGGSISHQTPNLQNFFFNPIVAYTEDEEPIYNYEGRDLSNIRSMLVELEHSWVLAKNWRLKTQLYWQEIDRALVEDQSFGDPNFSMINSELSFFAFYYNRLENRGRGRNRGIDLSLEHLFTNGLYSLASFSLFQSEFTGNTGEWRPTLFDNRYLVNILIGKEWYFGKDKRQVFFSDIRFATRGGRPYRPIDAEATYQEGFQSGNLEPVYSAERAFLERTPAFYQLDLKLGLRLNSATRRLSHTLRLDLFNVLNTQNIFTYQYSAVFNPFGQPERGDIIPIYQRGFIPDLTYMLQF